VVAAELQRRCPPGTRVLLLFDPGLEFVTAFWGCLMGGMIAVPVYPPTDARSKDRLFAIARDAAAACALSTSAILRRSFLARIFYSSLRAMRWIGTDRLPDSLAASFKPPDVGPETVALIQYTSGSISAPKGVQVLHRNLARNIGMICEVMNENNPGGVASDSLVSWLPLYHDMGLIGGVIIPPLVGGRSILMSPLMFLQKPVRWLSALSRYGATVSAAPNFAYELCVRKIPDEQVSRLDLSRWTLSFNGAETVRAETLERFARKFAPAGFRPEALYPTYGLAEATLFVAGGRRMAPPVILSVRLDPTLVFEHPTIHRLATHLAGAGPRPTGRPPASDERAH
jgi:acyl-CoA synthetase (AMP-forming)/AMP-acid ligase II